MTEQISSDILVKYIKESLDSQIECLEEFIDTDLEEKEIDRYKLSIFKLLRRNVDTVSSEKVPDKLLCLKCGMELNPRR